VIKGNRKYKIAFIVLVCFAMLCYFIAFVVTAIIPYPSEKTTSKYTTIVTSLEKRHDNLFVIHLQEYNVELHIAKSYAADWSLVSDIKVGQSVVFRISNDTSINGLNFISPVSLEIDGKEIITFRSYSNQIDMAKFGGRLSGSVFGTISLFASLLCFLAYKGIILTKVK